MDLSKYKGIVKLNIYGEDRYFKFGTAHMAMLCERLGKNMEETTKLQADSTNVGVQIEHYYCAAVCYVRLYNDETEGDKLKEPTYNQVANWFDGMVYAQIEKINEEAFKLAFPNENAPDQTKEGAQS